MTVYPTVSTKKDTVNLSTVLAKMKMKTLDVLMMIYMQFIEILIFTLVVNIWKSYLPFSKLVMLKVSELIKAKFSLGIWVNKKFQDWHILYAMSYLPSRIKNYHIKNYCITLIVQGYGSSQMMCKKMSCCGKVFYKLSTSIV